MDSSRLSEQQILKAALEIIDEVKKRTADVATGRKILDAASHALGGGFTQDVATRLGDREYLSEGSSTPA